MSCTAANSDVSASATPRQYVVVARRYRPQTFAELIGQEHVAQALSNAIATGRVGHAYLFTGARGVGKTSAARILAKALNCEKGPTPVSCNQCDICQSISTGEDVDVLEIDGASNRGIDEIRQLRQNVNVRPSRARYKIYIIDEVHMLTREAFNALLKTLEEPPEHVKFIFCTTEPTKIPITILSRCQRFDFAGILTDSIRRRLEQIVAAEGVEAEPEALEVLARRAAGSMRDSQSLLEQLLAFSSGKITLAEVHGMLGTAGDERLAALVERLVERDSAAALAEFDAALTAGVDAPQLVEQLFGYFRDCMAATVGCPPESFLFTSPAGATRVAEDGRKLGLGAVLAAMQILDQALSHMRYSTQGRIIAELAIVEISRLEELEEVSRLIEQMRSGTTVAANPRLAPTTRAAVGHEAAKKNLDPPITSPAARPTPVARTSSEESTSAASTASARSTLSQAGPSPEPDPALGEPLTTANAPQVWAATLSRLSGMVVEQAKRFDSVAVPAPDRLVIRFKPQYDLCRSACDRPEQVARFEQALADVTGRQVRVEFSLSEDDPGQPPPVPPARANLQQERWLAVMKHPLIQRAGELFGATPVHIEDTSSRGQGNPNPDG